jgi:hypothetical protein
MTKQVENDSATVASLQTGILDYAEAYKRWLPFQLHEPGACHSFHLAQWERLTRFPDRREAKLLARIFHTNEFVGKQADIGEKNSAVQKPIRHFLTSIRKERVWPEGFYAGLKIPGANLLFNLYRLICKQNF